MPVQPVSDRISTIGRIPLPNLPELEATAAKARMRRM